MTATGVTGLRDTRSLARACKDDPLVLWAAQTLRPGVRAWAAAGAVAVATPSLSNRDRLAVCGPPGPVAALLDAVREETGPSYRVLGPAQLVATVAERIDGLSVAGRFGWMETVREAPVPAADPGQQPHEAGWLGPADGSEVAEILQSALPESHARPGVPGVRRWAGIRADGCLAAVAADAWSTRPVGFVSGVATRPHLQGLGFGRAVVRFLFEAMRRDHPRLGLFVDGGNEAAIRLYKSLGMALRPVAAAAFDPGATGR